MHHRDELFLRWHKSRVNTHIHNVCKKFRNRTRQEIRKSKREYCSNFFETHKANMKQLWSGIKIIITLKPRSQQLVSQIRVDNIDYDDPKDIASQLNKFFINVADDVRKTIPSAPKSHKEYLKEKLEKIEKTVNAELTKVNRWLLLNKLALNVEKSHLFYFILEQKLVEKN